LSIANSKAAEAAYRARWKAPRRIEVIYNGFDSARFRPDPDARKRVRKELGFDDTEVVIGLPARLDPLKDHQNFFSAAALLLREGSNASFVCIGGGPVGYTHELEAAAARLGLGRRIVWAGPRLDMPALYNALDIATNCSFSESLPNTVGEAMACGIPCVATDVGETAVLMGGTGILVRPRDPVSLAAGWKAMMATLASDADRIKRSVRTQIVKNFGIAALVDRTETVLESLCR
jgi:glycosyltransferase involved in cell wall biosynthesis